MGGRYDPVTDAWSPVSTAGAPSPRMNHSAVWTGHEMIIWGGNSSNPDTGGKYDPVSDSWVSTSMTIAPSARTNHTAVWTGTRMIIWGGFDAAGATDTGAFYDPVFDRWQPTTTIGAPEARGDHTAVWTGTEMLVWGGESDTGPVQTGARFQNSPQRWTPIPIASAPVGRSRHSVIWTDSRMIIWGGYSASNEEATGGQYDPVIDSWTPTSTVGAPVARYSHTAVWTGSRMVIWGGSPTTTVSRSGGPAYTHVQLPAVTASDGCDPDISFSRAEEPFNVPFGSNNFVYGTTTVTYSAQPTFGPSASCSISVTVQDTTPPELSVSTIPALLWPPNHLMAEVVSDASAVDTCGSTEIILTALTSSEPDDAPGGSDGSTVSDIQGDEIGTPDIRFLLRAERDGNGAGRSYMITYEVIDAVGLRSTATAFVMVPLSLNGLRPR